MQYANTSRKGAEANNAGFCSGSAVVRVSAAGGVVRGQPVLIPYKWEAAAWAEIESRVVGMCAYEERGPGQGLGWGGGWHICGGMGISVASGWARHTDVAGGA